jgi:hypothetical protein
LRGGLGIGAILGVGVRRNIGKCNTLTTPRFTPL